MILVVAAQATEGDFFSFVKSFLDRRRNWLISRKRFSALVTYIRSARLFFRFAFSEIFSYVCPVGKQSDSFPEYRARVYPGFLFDKTRVSNRVDGNDNDRFALARSIST